MIVYRSTAQRKHAPAHQFDGSGHVIEPYPETPARIAAILEALAEAGAAFEIREASGCDPRDLPPVHDPGLLEFLRDIYPFYHRSTGRIGPVVPDTMNPGRDRAQPAGSPRRRPASLLGQLGWYGFDAQTPITEGTWEAALGAASCALAAARAVAAGAGVAYAACRPPGHHSGPDFYGGYGFLNNAALAAASLAAGGARVAVIDVDYHHGNGTQEIFYRDPAVLYVSLHADPDWAYPYFWGRADEHGAGAGEGATRNFPLALGSREAAYLAALDDAVRVASAFAADRLVVSLGTDTFAGDPLGTFGLGVDSFARIGERIARLRLPAVIVQEGGYNVAEIGRCVRRFLEGLLG